MNKRKVFVGIMFLAVLVFSTSCFDLFEDTGIKIASDYIEAEIPIVADEAGEYSFPHEVMQTDVDAILEKEGQYGTIVKSIQISDAYVEMMDKSAVSTFDAVESLEASFSNDLLEEEVILVAYNKEMSATSLPFEILVDDVKDYLESTDYYFTLNGVLREPIADTMWVKAKVKYEIIVGVSED